MLAATGQDPQLDVSAKPEEAWEGLFDAAFHPVESDRNGAQPGGLDLGSEARRGADLHVVPGRPKRRGERD